MANWSRIVTLAVMAGCSGGGGDCDTANCADSGDSGDVYETRDEVSDVGQACIDSTDPLEVTVSLEDCASSCIRDLQTSCSAEVVGGDLIVEASASWLPPASGTCDAACNVIQATCTVAAPPAGAYTLVYGGQSTSLQVPLAEPTCVGELW